MCTGIFDIPNLMPGWGCCKCRVYNGLQRKECKRCGVVRHEITIPEGYKSCECGFTFDPVKFKYTVCPSCYEEIPS